jgi:hypothetical protein
VVPPLQPVVVGSFPDTGCMVPESFAVGGNRSYPQFSAVIGSPRNLGYITPTVVPEPSIERVAGAGHSTVGRRGTHMVLYTLPRDSVVRLRE